MGTRSCTTCGSPVDDGDQPRCPSCGATLPRLAADPSGRFRGHEDVVAAQQQGMRSGARGPKLLALVVLLAAILIVILVGTAGQQQPQPDEGDGAGPTTGALAVLASDAAAR